MSVKYFPEKAAVYGPFVVRLLHYRESFNCEIREFVIEVNIMVFLCFTFFNPNFWNIILLKISNMVT